MRSPIPVLCILCLALAACGGGALDDTDEVGQAAGDVMASFDESGEGGAFAMRPVLYRPEYGKPAYWQQLRELVSPSAEAAGCFTARFTACDAGKRTKTFDQCALGASTLSGTVGLTFSQPGCTVQAVNDTLTRTADLTLTGPRAGTLSVASPGGGQTVTKTATGFSYKVGGLQRSATDPKGKKLFDISTSTRADITVTGASRKERVMDGGQLEVKHNLAGYTTLLSPKQVKWDATCNCAVSGQWDGTLTTAAGKSETFNVTITGCGKATVTAQGKSKSVELDRCAGF